MKTLLYKITIILFLSFSLCSADSPYVPNETDFPNAQIEPLPQDILDNVPIALESFMTRLGKSIDWNAFFHGLDLGIVPTIGYCADVVKAARNAGEAGFSLLTGDTAGAIGSGLAAALSIVGIETGSIEPIALTEFVKRKYDLKAIGADLGADKLWVYAGETHHNFADDHESAGGSWAYYHVYRFPIFGMIFKKLVESSHEVICLEPGNFNMLYLSEFDPAAHDMFIQAFLHPELWISLVPHALIPMGISSCMATEILELRGGEYKQSILDKKGNRAVVDSIYPINGCIGAKIPGTFTQNESSLENSINVTYGLFWLYGKLGAIKQTVKSAINGYDKEILCEPQRNNKGFVHTQFLNQLVTPRISKLHELGVASIPHYIAKEDGSSGEDIVNLLWIRRHYAAGPYQCINTLGI